MDNGKYNVLIFNYNTKGLLKLRNINSKYVDNLQECLHNLSMFCYDAILIRGDVEKVDVCRIISAIRLLTQAPLVVIADIDTKFIEEIAYAGGDAVMEKSCSDKKISIHLWTLARRYRQWNDMNIQEKTNKNIVCDKLLMNRKQYTAHWNGIKLYLTRQEYDFLYLLASSPRRIYTFEQIYQLVWKDYPVGDIKNIIWCLVKRLRKKLNVVEDSAGNCIVSVRDVGYKFELNNEK